MYPIQNNKEGYTLSMDKYDKPTIEWIWIDKSDEIVNRTYTQQYLKT